MADTPSTNLCLILTKVSATSKDAPPPLNETTVQTRPVPALKDGEVLVRMVAAAFNHRELWQKKNMYPGIADGSVMGCDGAGIVIASAQGPNDALLNKRVLLNPIRGWISDPTGPEGRLTAIGGIDHPPIGTIAQYVAVERDEVIEVPEHLSFQEAAAWPCAGLTAWRATFVKGALKPGQNVLITGIGGGVALTCLQLCVAAGAKVFVSSGDQTKIDRAIALGAVGGVNYRQDTWPQDLKKLLSSTASGTLDLVIDQGGGDICGKVGRLMKNGGIISCFGMHTQQSITFPMTMVLKNVEVRGSTLGSRKEFIEATEFLREHKIHPVVSHVIDGIQNATEGFDLLHKGDQMGKIVVKIDPEADAKL